ncbi:heavy metal translocating P-type ATPase [Aquamicrobium sp. LC103]|uniref:heavy metal translocating P-type ATPase n=1 Tax=Aquamicrobium sp. LC103 TaxID=1120658 RepID=UPI0032B22B81
MDCASCAGIVRAALERMPGVSDLHVSVPRERLKLVLDENRTDRGKIVKAIESLGFTADLQSFDQNHPDGHGDGDRHVHADCGHDHEEGHGQRHGEISDHVPKAGQTTVSVGGMDCASCAGTITAALEKMPGVSDIHVSVARERLSLTLTPGGATLEDVLTTVRRLGFTAGEAGNAPGATGATGQSRKPEKSPWWQAPKARHLFYGGAFVAGAFATSYFLPELRQWTLGVATVLAALPIVRRALAAARLGAPFTIQMLMTIAVIGAIIIGETAEAAIVVLLFILGEMLEGLAADHARSGIRALGELLPRDALVEEPNGRTTRVAADALRVGQVVVCRPGDRIAADGEILTGISSVDESPITGESVPVTKEPGERVRAGTVNHEATLRVRVDRSPEDNTISRIIALVEEAQDSKAPTERFIDRFSRVYMPIVVVIAALVAIVPPMMGLGDWETWIYRALALLLIGCPCALVISVPAAVAASLAAGARAGMLIKGGVVLETLAGAKRVVFDKTGTLTVGKPRVTDMITLEGSGASTLAIAAAVERESSHPLAAAIVAHAMETGVGKPTLSARKVKVVPGKGMEGSVDGRAVFIGAPRHAADRAQFGASAQAQIDALEEQGKTVIVVVVEGRALSLIAMRDEPRAEARSAIETLRRQSVGALMMTGDNPRTGAAIGRQLGIDVEAGMLPEDKSRRLAEIAVGENVVMVGDGVNDAPALATANVGIAIGSGTDVAMEAADAALMRDRIDDVPRMLGLARSTMSNIRQNVVIALGLKAVFLVTTVTGYTGLWLAIFADTGATVLVTLNAMRLLAFFHGRGGNVNPTGMT